ncbi:Sulfotransferase domain [Trinorchestia longiramus]|nr:Sulfotransferase domain [Trinorchestia longiramus]
MELSNGAKVTSITGEEAKDLQENFLGYKDGLLRAGPSKCVLPQAYTRYAERYLNFQFRKSDVVVATYPKCGTTWAQEIIWTMIHNPDLDNPDANLHRSVRSPFLEYDTVCDSLVRKDGHYPAVLEALKRYNPTASPNDGVFISLSNSAPDRRVFKTHLPFSLLPADMLDSCKVVYVIRNPKDILASFLHHSRLLACADFKGTDEQFTDYFCSGKLIFGSYAENLVEAWRHKNHKNFLLVSFEDLKRNIEGELRRIDQFIGTKLNEKQLQNVKSQSGFQNMKLRLDLPLTEQDKTTSRNQNAPSDYDEDAIKKVGFFRKGESGAWKKDISETSSAKIDRYIAENITPRIPDLKFSFE